MDTKLTLTIEQKLINRAKVYAKSRGRSLSDLVENYFKFLISSEEMDKIEITSTVKSLKGSIKAPKDFDYKQVLEDEILKKHL